MADYLLLPAKDEAQNLPWILERASEVGLIPVVCDDGSVDGTAEVALAYGARVLKHKTNLGLAAALKTLFLFALAEGREGDLFLLMDADGTMDPALFPGLKEALLRKEAEMLIVSRFRGGVKGLPLLRRALSLGARFYYSLLYPGTGITDWTTGWRVYSYSFLRRYWEAYPELFQSEGFTAQTEILLRALQLNPRARVVEEGGVINYGRKRGRSKMRILRTAYEYLNLGLKVRFGQPQRSKGWAR